MDAKRNYIGGIGESNDAAIVSVNLEKGRFRVGGIPLYEWMDRDDTAPFEVVGNIYEEEA